MGSSDMTSRSVRRGGDGRCDRHRKEAEMRIKSAAGGRPGGKGDVHRRADPGHDRAGVAGSGQCEAPVENARDHEALGATEHGATGEQDRERDGGDTRQKKRKQIENARRYSGDQADDRRLFRTPSVGEMAGGEARDERSTELTARDEADSERRKAKGLVHVQRQHGHGDADHQISGEDHRQDGQQGGRHGRRRDSLWARHEYHRKAFLVGRASRRPTLNLSLLAAAD
jgi:hypothetical protein